MRPGFELADAVNLFGAELLAKERLTPLKQKVLGKIASCRTAALGGHEEMCNRCGSVRYSYNSCGDRHCPKCQAAKQAFWIDDLIHGTLPIKHYHIVFTVPHQLNAVCLHNQRMYYNLLFEAIWNTLRTFGYSPQQKPNIDTLIKQKEPPETNWQRFERLTGINPCNCPVCKKGTMLTVRELPRIRSPSWHSPVHPAAATL